MQFFVLNKISIAAESCNPVYDVNLRTTVLTVLSLRYYICTHPGDLIQNHVKNRQNRIKIEMNQRPRNLYVRIRSRTDIIVTEIVVSYEPTASLAMADNHTEYRRVTPRPQTRSQTRFVTANRRLNQGWIDAVCTVYIQL